MRLTKEELANLTNFMVNTLDDIRRSEGHTEADLADGMSMWSYFKIAQANLDAELYEKTQSDIEKSPEHAKTFSKEFVLIPFDEKVNYIYNQYHLSLSDKILKWTGIK